MLTGLWYFDTTLWQTVPLLQDELVRALADTYPDPGDPADRGGCQSELVPAGP